MLMFGHIFLFELDFSPLEVVNIRGSFNKYEDCFEKKKKGNNLFYSEIFFA